MTAIQLERLKQDSMELETYAEKLKKKGLIDRMKKVLQKRAFLDRRIAEVTY
tara:strand:+ start:8119 stop:8274 length:156 start_codon:yes stop_codon:yes gene_type:complete